MKYSLAGINDQQDGHKHKKLTSRQVSHSFGWLAGGYLLPGKLSLHSDKLISCTNNQAAGEAGKCPKSAGEPAGFPGQPGRLGKYVCCDNPREYAIMECASTPYVGINKGIEGLHCLLLPWSWSPSPHRLNTFWTPRWLPLP